MPKLRLLLQRPVAYPWKPCLGFPPGTLPSSHCSPHSGACSHEGPGPDPRSSSLEPLCLGRCARNRGGTQPECREKQTEGNRPAVLGRSKVSGNPSLFLKMSLLRFAWRTLPDILCALSPGSRARVWAPHWEISGRVSSGPRRGGVGILPPQVLK